MTLAEFTLHLRRHPSAELRFRLPDGRLIEAHAHITEAGRVDKTFIDCGGTVRTTSTCQLQSWVADDVDHRLSPDRLADILDRAGPLLRDDQLPVEIEFEHGLVSQFPVTAAEGDGGLLTFSLGTRHTDCLARDRCLPSEEEGEKACRPGGGCC